MTEENADSSDDEGYESDRQADENEEHKIHGLLEAKPARDERDEP